MKWLALCYDESSLQDIADSNIKNEDVIAILDKTNIDLDKNRVLIGSFHKIVPLKEYLSSGSVELTTLNIYESIPLAGIIATNELDILRAGRLREHLQFPGQNYQSALAFSDKVLMKEILTQHGVNVPPFQRINDPLDILDFVKEFGLPAIVKPARGTGSEGIKILRDEQDVTDFLSVPNHFHINEPLNLQIESYMTGVMYHINGLYLNGDLSVCWPSVYPHQSIQMLEGRYASSFLLSEENPLVNPLTAFAEKVLKALPTPEHAAFHLEVFVDQDEKITFCEIGSRVGGKGVRQSWDESFNIKLGSSVINAHAGLKVFNRNISFPLKPNYLTGEIWFPKQQGTLKSIENLCPFPWVKDYKVFAQPGEVVASPKDISQCLAGTPLVVADSETQMQQRLDDVAEWFKKNTFWSTY